MQMLEKLLQVFIHILQYLILKEEWFILCVKLLDIS
nr:MAG TPA: hypothetical protein [Bacteriophage sp.]